MRQFIWRIHPYTPYKLKNNLFLSLRFRRIWRICSNEERRSTVSISLPPRHGFCYQKPYPGPNVNFLTRSAFRRMELIGFASAALLFLISAYLAIAENAVTPDPSHLHYLRPNYHQTAVCLFYFSVGLGATAWALSISKYLLPNK